MELFKIYDHSYIPIHTIIKINKEGPFMYIYYQQGSLTDYRRFIIRDGYTMEQEIQSRLVNISPTKGFINAI